MWLLVNHTKPTKTLLWNYYLLTAGNHKSVSGQLQNSEQLQNHFVIGTILITINRLIKSGYLPSIILEIKGILQSNSKGTLWKIRKSWQKLLFLNDTV